jgi:hypothetical protein
MRQGRDEEGAALVLAVALLSMAWECNKQWGNNHGRDPWCQLRAELEEYLQSSSTKKTAVFFAVPES